MFKKIFIDLCNKKKESPSSVCRKIGLSNATFSCWADDTVPRRATLQRIADYFNVTVDYLLGNEKEKPADEDELSKEFVIYHRDGKTTKRKLTEKQMEMLAKMIDAIPEEEDE